MYIGNAGRLRRQAGISLIEMVMFIVIIGVGLAGILSVFNVTTKSSADPLLRKQALAIAESILEEVQLMPFTFCDPDDANAATATGAADCDNPGMDQNKAGGALITPTPATETRYDVNTPFDNVADYGGFAMESGGIFDMASGGVTKVPGLDGYKLKPISITRVGYGGIAANGDALLIRVTVTDPRGEDISVEGIRTRYAPRAVP